MLQRVGAAPVVELLQCGLDTAIPAPGFVMRKRSTWEVLEPQHSIRPCSASQHSRGDDKNTGFQSDLGLIKREGREIRRMRVLKKMTCTARRRGHVRSITSTRTSKLQASFTSDHCLYQQRIPESSGQLLIDNISHADHQSRPGR
jgi:hypothetical protein